MKKKTPQNNSADQQNANKGTSGTNIAYDKVQGNRGKQKNPNRVVKVLLLLILTTAFYSCGGKNKVTPDPCDCPQGNISATFNDLLGKWRVTKRTFYDPTGTTVNKVEDLTNVVPFDEDALSFRVYIDEDGEKVIEMPLGALVGIDRCFLVKLPYRIDYFRDGGSCFKVALMDVCILEFTPNYIKMRHMWNVGYTLQEYEAIKE